MKALIHGAFLDLAAGLKLRGVWTALAAEDVGDVTRRARLGPLWVVLNYLLFAGTFMVIFRGRFDIDNFPAYVAIGLLVWLFISENLSSAVTLFTREESFIKGTVLPLSVYVLRQCMQSAIRSGYTLLGAVGILLLTRAVPSPIWLASLPAVALLFLTAPAAVIVLAIAGVLLPDLQFVVGNLMRVGMFLTPVFWWHGGMGGIRVAFFHLNPFTHYLEIVRAPILFGDVPLTSWQICLTISALLWLTAIPLLGKFRKRLVFFL